MNSNNACYTILVIAIMVILSGCAPGCGVLSIPGSLSVSKGMDSGSYCKLNLTYTNTSNRTVRPGFRAVFYDGNGNTIIENEIGFSTINPGRSQTLERFIECSGQNIKKMQINEAVDNSSCDSQGSKCWRICGVYNQEYSWQK